MMLNSDSPLWEDSNKLNLVKIRLLGMEKLAIEGLTLYIWKSILYTACWSLIADFSTPSVPIFTRFSLLESSQRGESEFNIII